MDNKDTTEYRVLARKYRPTDFKELIGQEAMVRTLSNAIETGRLAHAFILTGVRGVGKTTTARIIAKALNCIGSDGKGSATIDPCGICDNCVSIAQSRHVDVMEMDAASRTGVDDIREIIDGVRYAAVSARYKIYIIDEVHMLSRNAFNALLKTLEEPPSHVKFIFATTEIRKVPVTVLSRCQRFDLRRISIEELAKHYGSIAEKENCKIDEKALAMIARASEGSVRDGLSLLDQAFAHGAGDVSEEQVREMLGLADRALILDLYEMIMQGKTPEALTLMRSQYEHGADPAVVLGDMLELTHWLTRLKVVPDAGEDMVTSEAEREQGGKMAAALALPVLTRAWQMLLKGLAEVRMASSPIAAAEMVIIRMTYAASLPNPADLVKQLRNNPPAQNSGAGSSSAQSSAAVPAGNSPSSHNAPTSFNVIQGSGLSAVRIMDSQPVQAGEFLPCPDNFAELVTLFEQQNEAGLAYNLRDNTHLEKFEIGRLSFRLKENVPKDLIGRISEKLKQWTGRPWMISLSQQKGDNSLYEQEMMEQAALRSRMEENSLVKAILDNFKGSEITKTRRLVNDFLMGDGSGLSDYLVSEDEFGLDDDY